MAKKKRTKNVLTFSVLILIIIVVISVFVIYGSLVSPAGQFGKSSEKIEGICVGDPKGLAYPKDYCGPCTTGSCAGKNVIEGDKENECDIEKKIRGKTQHVKGVCVSLGTCKEEGMQQGKWQKGDCGDWCACEPIYPYIIIKV